MFFKSKVRKSKEYQDLLRKCLRIKEICNSAINCYGDAIIDTYDFYKYRVLKAYPDQKKEPQEYSPYNVSHLYVQICIKYSPFIDTARKTIIENTHRKNKPMVEAYGKNLLGNIFDQNGDEFLKLTHLDYVDIAYDCIDLHPEWEDFIFHFPIYCLNLGAIHDDKHRTLLPLNEDVQKSNYKALTQKAANSKKLPTPKYVSTSNAKSIYQCTCGTKFRVPANQKHIIATCPKCKRKWDIKQ